MNYSMKKTMTVKEAAEILGTTQDYIRYGLRTGRLPFGKAVRNDKGTYRYFVFTESLQRWMDVSQR